MGGFATEQFRSRKEEVESKRKVKAWIAVSRPKKARDCCVWVARRTVCSMCLWTCVSSLWALFCLHCNPGLLYVCIDWVGRSVGGSLQGEQGNFNKFPEIESVKEERTKPDVLMATAKAKLASLLPGIKLKAEGDLAPFPPYMSVKEEKDRPEDRMQRALYKISHIPKGLKGIGAVYEGKFPEVCDFFLLNFSLTHSHTHTHTHSSISRDGRC
jgi:hypothetical protein